MSEHDFVDTPPLANVCVTLDLQQQRPRVVATFRRVHLDDGQASTLLLCLCSTRGIAAIGLDEGTIAKCYRCKRIYRVPAVPESDAGLSDPVWVEPIDDGDGSPFEGPHWSTPRIGR